METINSVFFAPEVERATVSLAWHFPEAVLPPVLRHLDPLTHFTQPWCSDLIQAINLVFDRLTKADWPTVIDCLRQQHKLVDNEYLVDLDEIFSLALYHRRATKDLLTYYIELLKDYALLRGPLPPKLRPPVLQFSGGSGLLKPNKTRRPDSSDPDFTGRAYVAGTPYLVSLWIDKDEFKQTIVKLRFKPAHGL